ncbi:hypothetical protein KFE98_16820 [bacterium SCSIO 12741]|nr:hypothetical protein KFE98_16820 [bacterium SCSIO 12741]
MSTNRDWSKVVSALKEGNIDALKRLKSNANSDGNDSVDIQWDIDYQAEYQQITSTYNLTPKNAGDVVSCTLSGLMEGENIVTASIASQLSPISTSGDGSYTGMDYCNYSPSGSVTIDGSVTGTLEKSDGTSVGFNFTKSIVIS